MYLEVSITDRLPIVKHVVPTIGYIDLFFQLPEIVYTYNCTCGETFSPTEEETAIIEQTIRKVIHG